ncbi:MAG TPA: extracellular solute-binding protein [Rhizobiaceae bacterium]|nr:extracellular solute-binding protein [Rhizobiaceae bacterium]
MASIRNRSGALAGIAGATFASMLVASSVFAQDYPSDEAALYEAAKKEGTVVWYESAPLEPMKAIALEFEKKYPGVKVEVLRIVGVQQYQRFMEEVQSGQHNVDILHISDQPSMKALIDEGHVAEWQVPTHDRFPAEFHLGAYSYANYTTDNAIIYNVNKVTPEEVEILEKSWKGVLDPRFKGRFAVTTMKCGACYAGIHMFMDPKLKDEYGEEFLKQVAAQEPAVYSEVLVGLDRVIAGEHDFTYWTWEGIAMTKWQQSAPIRWLHPKPTPVFGNSWQAVSKYAPHPNAARLFQNWSMSEEGATALQQLYGSATVLKDMADTRAVTKEDWYKPIEEPYAIDFDRWNENFHSDLDIWINILKTSQR